MASEAAQFLRTKYPELGDVPDREFSQFMSEKHPELKADLEEPEGISLLERGRRATYPVLAAGTAGGRGLMAALGELMPPGKVEGPIEAVTRVATGVGKGALHIMGTIPTTGRTLGQEIGKAIPGGEVGGPLSLSNALGALGEAGAMVVTTPMKPRVSVPPTTPYIPKPRVKMPLAQAKTGLLEAGEAPPRLELGQTPPQILASPPPAPKARFGEFGGVRTEALYTGARMAGGAVVGAGQGDTLEDQIRYGAMGAAFGAAADPRLIKAAVAGLKTPGPSTIPGLSPGAREPSQFAIATAQMKIRFPENPAIGWTPQDVVKNIPAGEIIVGRVFRASSTKQLLAQDFKVALGNIYKPIFRDPASVIRVNRLLDSQQLPLSPVEQTVAAQARQFLDNAFTSTGLPPGRKLSDYFPHLREELATIRQVIIEARGHPIIKELPTEYTTGFMKPRTLQMAADDYSLRAMERYVEGLATRLSLKGGTNPITGQRVQGLLDKLEDNFAQLPDVPELQEYLKTYVNQYIWPPQANTALLTPRAVNIIKQVEFIRTIGLNVTSPINNSMQVINTLAKVDPRSWTEAFYDIANPKTRAELIQRAHRAGVVTDLKKVDIDFLSSPSGVESAAARSVQVTGYGFRKSEQYLRLHAFAAGLRDAARYKLINPDDYARMIVDSTQFRYGAENLPAGMRTRGGLRELSRQYKPFTINQAQFIKNLISEDLTGLRYGRLPTQTAKWIAGITTIAGPSAIAGHEAWKWTKNAIADMFGVNPESLEYKGLASGLGVYVGEQVGISALPVETVRDFMFFLPGPAIAHFLDGVSISTKRRFNAQDIATGNAGKEMEPAEWASKVMTTGAGIWADRLRKAFVISQDPRAEVRQPRTTPEAFGMAPPTGQALHRKQTAEAARTAAGLRMPEVAEAQERRTRQAQLQERWSLLIKHKSEAMAAGDMATVQRIDRQGVKEFGQVPPARKPGVKGAVERGIFPWEERRAQRRERGPVKELAK